MSTVETPPPPTPVERRCPRCGARLSAEQEWCLECGAAVGTRIAEPRGWRASVAVVGVLLALALIAVVLAIVELSRDAEGVQEVAATPTPDAAASAVPTATPAPGAEGGATPAPPRPSPTPSRHARQRRPTASPGLAEWPEGRTAWTVVLNSSGTREDAERLAGELAAKGVPDVGVIDSDDFESLGPDSFVVFSGIYDTEARGPGGARQDPRPGRRRVDAADRAESRDERSSGSRARTDQRRPSRYGSAAAPRPRASGCTAQLLARAGVASAEQHRHQRRHRARQRAEVVAALEHEPDRRADRRRPRGAPTRSSPRSRPR